MNPTQLSAQFAAYVWYLNQRDERPAAEEEAVRFAQENWTAFRPCAHEGLGRLLLRVAGEGQKVREGNRERVTGQGRSRSPHLLLAGAAAE